MRETRDTGESETETCCEAERFSKFSFKKNMQTLAVCSRYEDMTRESVSLPADPLVLFHSNV